MDTSEVERQTVRVKDDNQFLRKFGRKVAEVRRGKGLTQEQLADAINVHRTYIGYIEQGKRNPSIGNIKKICDSLRIKLSELFTGL